jgi:AcrR family transcriptional regulator
MDELAVRAGVSRATLYRLFPGKPALFTRLLRTYSPLEPVSRLANSKQDQPPEVVMPEIARTVYGSVSGPGAPGIGLLRAIFFEVSSLSPDAEEAARDAVTTIFGSVGAYVMAQMAAGRLRMMHPLLALQAFIGPIFFHLLTRSLAERLAGFDMDGEQAVVLLAEHWLHAMRPDQEELPMAETIAVASKGCVRTSAHCARWMGSTSASRRAEIWLLLGPNGTGKTTHPRDNRAGRPTQVRHRARTAHAGRRQPAQYRLHDPAGRPLSRAVG